MAANYGASNMHAQALSIISSTPRLTGVSPEIFELIASHIDGADLGSLRLTCHTSAANVMRTFARVHFKTRSVLLCDQESIQDAVRAAKHPEFGRYLNDLAIHADKHADQAYGLYLYPSKGPYLPASTYGLQAVAGVANLGSCRTMLEHLFQVIQQRGAGLRRLGLFDKNADQGGCYSKLRIWRDASLSLPGALSDSDAEPLDAVMEAAFATKVELHEFTIHTNDWTPWHRPASFASGEYLPLLHGLVSHVRRLEACVWPDPTSVSRFDVHSAIQTFLGVISEAPHLHSLYVHLWEEPDGMATFTMEPLLAKGIPSLRHLSLESAWLNMGTLSAFVQQGPSLRTLDLKDVDFMLRSFSEDVLKDFEFKDGRDTHDLVRKVIGLPGHYNNIWSDDVSLRG